MSVVRPTHHFHNNVTMCMNEQINLVVPSWRLAGYEANECVYMCTSSIPTCIIIESLVSRLHHTVERQWLVQYDVTTSL